MVSGTFDFPHGVQYFRCPSPDRSSVAALAIDLFYGKADRQAGGLVWFAAIVSFMVILNQLTMENAVLDHVRNILLVGLGGFSVVAFVAYGVLGYVNARVLQVCQKRGSSFGVVISAGLVLSSVMFAVVGSLATEGASGYVMKQWEHALLPFVRSEVMFLGVIALGGLFTRWWSECPVIEPLRLLGTYALCAFVFHRFVGQGLMTSLHLQGGELGTFLLMLAVISSSTYLLLVARQSIGGLDAWLKRLFL